MPIAYRINQPHTDAQEKRRQEDQQQKQQQVVVIIGHAHDGLQIIMKSNAIETYLITFQLAYDYNLLAYSQTVSFDSCLDRHAVERRLR